MFVAKDQKVLERDFKDRSGPGSGLSMNLPRWGVYNLSRMGR
jgi:hypothetical protein